ncbi:cysteine synthase A [Dickeya chrysanthemi]|uniref:cysteine synthase A n=1 Tax=Dickeya chrysanthemi TaxID=556 RepID=UPI0030158902
MKENSIFSATGSTPIIKLNNITEGFYASIFVKLEYLNPWGSIKDRIALEIIEKAEQDGRLKPGGHVVEATSGNTGISLAAVCAAKGYHLTIILPEFVSIERKILLRMMGANLILTPEAQGLVGPVAKSLEYVENNPDVFVVDQTRNPDNPGAHLRTGEEIWEQTEGDIDIFIAASGTGGHISGIGNYLKSRKPAIKVIAVEPEGAAVLSGKTPPGEATANHGLIGIGPGFIPKTLDRSVIDGYSIVNVDHAYDTARRIIAKEGLLIGASSGAVIAAALEMAANPENKGKKILVIATSQTERYLSTCLADEARAYVNELVPLAVEEKFIGKLL